MASEAIELMSSHIIQTNIDEGKLSFKERTLVDHVASVENKNGIHNFYAFASKYCCYHKP